MPRPIHFEIPADDPARAARFYSEVFGWKIQKWEGPMEYWMVMTGESPEPGIDGGLMKRQHPGQGVVNTVGVADVDQAQRAAEKNGGTTVVPKMAVPGVGWLVYCTDPEGNTFGMMQNDPNAK
jgi:predicted enzyme related to lactoylglutathione lyase